MVWYVLKVWNLRITQFPISGPDSLHCYLLSGVLMASGNICYWDLTHIMLDFFFLLNVFKFSAKENLANTLQTLSTGLFINEVVEKKAQVHPKFRAHVEGKLF